MCGEYHDESYNEQMEAQHGPYSNDAPLTIPARDVDAALRRIDKVVDEEMPTVYEADRQAVIAVRRIIREERARLGLPAEITA